MTIQSEHLEQRIADAHNVCAYMDRLDARRTAARRQLGNPELTGLTLAELRVLDMALVRIKAWSEAAQAEILQERLAV